MMEPVVSVGAAALSPREAEVLDALREYRTNAQIAQLLHISVRTVESHVSALLRKLGAADRRELATRAAERAADAAVVRHAFEGLPSSWTTFVGRSAEVEEVVREVADHRLVTVFGPGGIGKTRLATVVAERVAPSFVGGGAFVDLVPVTAAFMVPAVAAALGLVEGPQTPLETVVQDRLREGRTLLVLDNCEHVLDSVASFVQGLLEACPDAVVLATSRQALGLPGERLVRVPPLGVEAETLFVDRAAAGESVSDVDPALVTDICRRLDGLPLAIELAAARSRSLGIDGLVAGLDDHLRLLRRSSGPGGRHGSLRAVIDWSHDLLDEEERTLFRRLAIFAAGFDLRSATAVAADDDAAAASDVIGRLADKSLLVHARDAAGSRWRMLDTVRAYAREQLQAEGELESVRARHLAWAAASGTALEDQLDDDGRWVPWFDAVADDLRGALDAARPGPGPAATAFDLALALAHLTYARGFFAEARGHYDAASLLAPDDEGIAVAERHAADVAFAEMRGDLAFAYLMRSASAAEAAGDARGRAIALADAATVAGRAPATFDQSLPHESLMALVTQARQHAPAGDVEVSAHIAVAAAWNGRRGLTEPDPGLAAQALTLAQRLGDPVLISNALDAVASVEEFAGLIKEASRSSAERLTLLQHLPRHDPRGGGEVADIFHMATESAIYAGELPDALTYARRAHADPLYKGLPYLASSRLVIPLALQGQFDDALVHAEATRSSWEQAGRPSAGWMAPAFFATALVYGLRGDEAAYDRWREQAELLRIDGSPSDAFGAFVEQRVALHLGDLERALAASRAPHAAKVGRYDSFTRGISAEVAVVAGSPDAERRLVELTELAGQNDFAAACLARAAGRLHADEAALVRAVELWEVIGARFERACTLLLIPSRTEEGRRDFEALGCPPPRA